MKKIIGLSALSAFISAALAVFSSASFAGANPDARLFLKVVPHTDTGSCGTGRIGDCSEVVSNGDAGGAAYDVYVIASNFSEAAGVQFGIDYPKSSTDGLVVTSWKNCGAAEIPSRGFPDPGTGVAVVADSCIAAGEKFWVIGKLQVTAYGKGGRLSLTVDPRSKKALLGCCMGASVDSISSLGWADFGTGTGSAPCFTGEAKGFGISNIRPVADGAFTGIQWSPSGGRLLLLSNDGLYQVDLAKQVDPAKRTAPGAVHKGKISFYSWSPDGTDAIFVEETGGDSAKSVVMTADIASGKEKTLCEYLPGRIIGIKWSDGGAIFVGEMASADSIAWVCFNESGKQISCPPGKGSDEIVWTRGGGNSAQLMSSIPGEAEPKEVVKNAAWYYPMFSPGRDLICASGVFTPVARSASTCVFDRNGNLVSNLGFSLTASDWTPDGKWIIGSMKQTNHDGMITSSELYIFRFDGKERARLTSDKDKIEFGPMFSPDGKSVAFIDLNGNKVYLADFVRSND